MPDRPIGKPFPRKEGRKKVTGQALYVDDLSFPEMLHGATVRSPAARGKIKNISFKGDLPWDEFTVVTAKDIPGANYVALILNDQPYLAADFVNHPEEPVVLIAHKHKYLVEEARRHVRVEIEEQPAVFTLADSLAKKEIVWGNDNVFKKFLVDKGNVDEAWSKRALLAGKSGKPVKIIYDRAEDMVATTKRHPSLTRHKTAVTKDGKLVAMEIDFVVDGGAYCTLSPVVLSRGTIHAAGPYVCPNVRIHSRAVATNVPPHGAFRGFGAPQSIFALERHMDKVARAVGLTPEEFRRRNFIHEGETTATSQMIRERVDLNGLLDRALQLSD